MPSRTTSKPKPGAARARVRRTAVNGASVDGLGDRFFRQMVFNLRNGVLAITREGRIAVINEIAYRVLGMKTRTNDIGRHFSDVLREVPDLIRIIAGAFELSHLPNRAELRLKHTPTLEFEYDETIERGMRISELIEREMGS